MEKKQRGKTKLASEEDRKKTDGEVMSGGGEGTKRMEKGFIVNRMQR